MKACPSRLLVKETLGLWQAEAKGCFVRSMSRWTSVELSQSFNAKAVSRSGPSISVLQQQHQQPLLMDETVVLSASGLPPSSPVTLSVTLQNDAEKLHFHSKSFYVTSPEGCLELDKHEALPGGSYQGPDPMGPFWSMRPLGRSLPSLLTRTAVKPLSFNVQLWPGHKTGMENTASLAHTSVLRSYQSPGVKRIPVREGRVRGTLFLPCSSTEAPKPLIMTICNGLVRGHVVEEKAAMLAEKGFCSLAVAFYGVDDLPNFYGSTDVEYFEEALSLVSRRKEVDPDRIGVLGASKGGDLALSCTAFLPAGKIKACVALNSCIGSFAAPTTYKTQRVEALGAKTHVVPPGLLRPDGTLDCSGLLSTDAALLKPEMVIPFIDSPAHLLILAGEDDRFLNSASHARLAQQLLVKSGKSNFEVLLYPGLGHLCHLPFSPVAVTMTQPVVPSDVKLYHGGGDDPARHVAAQIDIWRRTIDFFRQKL